MNPPRPILVTGSHRSGTTWVGRVIASSPEVFYVHEPLNARYAPHYLGLENIPWYPFIHAGNEPTFRPGFERLLEGRFPALNARFLRPDKLLRFRLLHAVTFRRAAALHRRFLLKDPFALFSVDWFEEVFNAQAVLLVRHPAAFVASLKARNWSFDFHAWTSQPALLNGPLHHDLQAVRQAAHHPPDLVGQGCLLWNALIRHIQSLRGDVPHRICLRHEDVCANPAKAFRQLFERLDLPWSPRTEAFVTRSSSSESGRSEDNAFWFRDSRSVPRNWEKRLSPDEVDRIRTATAPLWESFYGPDSW